MKFDFSKKAFSDICIHLKIHVDCGIPKANTRTVWASKINQSRGEKKKIHIKLFIRLNLTKNIQCFLVSKFQYQLLELIEMRKPFYGD